MSPFETVSATQGYRERCEDRVAVFIHQERTVVVVADGAGGTGVGDVAAMAVIREVQAEYLSIHSANDHHPVIIGTMLVSLRFEKDRVCRLGDVSRWTEKPKNKHDRDRS